MCSTLIFRVLPTLNFKVTVQPKLGTFNKCLYNFGLSVQQEQDGQTKLSYKSTYNRNKQSTLKAKLDATRPIRPRYGYFLLRIKNSHVGACILGYFNRNDCQHAENRTLKEQCRERQNNQLKFLTKLIFFMHEFANFSRFVFTCVSSLDK